MSQNRVSPPIVAASAGGRRPVPPRARHPGPARPPRGLGPLTGLGVSLILLAACVLGSLLDLLLVGGPAWALVALYVAACGYTAYRVRGADWYVALVAPPIAFAIAMIMLAELMPDLRARAARPGRDHVRAARHEGEGALLRRGALGRRGPRRLRRPAAGIRAW